jgi:glycosyltransferase involved in cell wall biosynthesis
MSLRILVDLQGAQCGSRHRGIGRYSLALAKAIARNSGKHQVVILLNGLFWDSIADIQQAFGNLVGEDRFLVLTSTGPVAEVSSEDNSWRRRTAEILREHVIDTLSPDVVLITSMIEGAQDDTITSVGTLHTNVAVAAILYDLIPLMDPANYIGADAPRRWYDGKIDSLRRTDLLFGISQATTNDGIRRLQIPPERISNISSAADDSFSSAAVDPTHSAFVAKRYGIARRYLMHSSAFEARKNFQGLIRAYAGLSKSLRSQYQLVLVCKLDNSGRNELNNLASNVGLSPGDMVLTGFVPDEDLIALYSACHLFVFPSFQEGFGLPALEAMCCGTPTIGSNATSIPEVIGRDDALFDPKSVGEMTSLISRALRDTDFYNSLKVHAKTQAAKFSWDRTALRVVEGLEKLCSNRRTLRDSPSNYLARKQLLLEALANVAREFPPSDVEILDLARNIEANERAVTRLLASAAFGGPLKWRIEGPFDSTYSLAVLNRETARALAALGHTVILHSTEGPGDFAANRQFLELNSDLDVMHRRVEHYPGDTVDALSRNLYPPRVHDMKSSLNLLHHYAWEESGFPHKWVSEFNAHLDGLSCLSTHVEKVLLDNGVEVPMATSGCGVDHWDRIVPTLNYSVSGRGFRFLHVSSCFPRKGIDVLLEAYGRVFTDADDVSLVIKTFANPHNDIHSLLSKHRDRASNFPHVIVIEGDLSEGDLKSLYQQCHALVAPSRAEGFGLPLAEAMLSGLAVITTGWSGQLEFCNDETAWLIDFKFRAAQSHFGLFDSVWADPDIASLAKALSDVWDAPLKQRQAKAKAGKEFLLENCNWRDVVSRLVVSAKRWQSTVASDLPHIGWITTWNTRCGIAAYSEHLLAKFPQPVTILAPRQPGKIRDDGPNCIRSWLSSKEENGFGELSRQIGILGLNTIVVQFNYGFYNFRQLNDFINAQIDAGRVVIVMMHSTTDPGVPPVWNWSLAEVVTALARCQRILVHSIADLNRLKEIGLVRNVSMFPHGVMDLAIDASPIQNAIPLICSYGYCLPHKGLIELVQAADILRQEGTPVRLRLVNAEYPAAISAELVIRIRALVTELGLEDLVELCSEYMTDVQAAEQLSAADLIVFPYRETSESASGAVRFGLATRRPIGVTPIAIFAELGDAVHIFPGTTPQDLASGIRATLRELADRSETARKIADGANNWRTSHTYEILGARLHSICKALARDIKPFRRVFDGSNSQLKTEIAQISGRSIETTGRQGYLVYGPNLVLPAGQFRIMVVGHYKLPAGSLAHFDVAGNGGGSILARLDFFLEAEGTIADLTISLPGGCRDVEFRISVDARAQLRVDRIEISAIAVENCSELSERRQSVGKRQSDDERLAPIGATTNP